MIKTCMDCQLEFEASRKDVLRCAPCKRKHRSLQVMISRKKYHPEIELGVGSGRAKNNLSGPANQSWKTGIVGYRKLITKDQCALCGSKKHLLIHHKDEDRHNNEVNNLEVYCKSCHQKYHVLRSPITGQYLAK